MFIFDDQHIVIQFHQSYQYQLIILFFQIVVSINATWFVINLKEDYIFFLMVSFVF